MPARKHETNNEKFIDRKDVQPLNEGTTITDLLERSAAAIAKTSHNGIIAKHGIDWKTYKPVIKDNVGYIIRETCERCGKVTLAPGQRKLRCIQTDIGPIYLDTGVCKDCINASIYVDRYLDGDPLSETEAKKLYYEYAQQYEKQWRITLATAPRIAMTKAEWDHRCKFFGGCALCGGFIEVQHKYFPSSLNGFYTPWNIIPLCGDCAKRYKQVGKRSDPTKAPRLYRVFSSRTYFQKTKTIRLFLLAQMEYHGIYMDNLAEYRKRFFERQILKHSIPSVESGLPDELVTACIVLSRSTAASLASCLETVSRIYGAGIPVEDIIKACESPDSLVALELLSTSIRFMEGGNLNELCRKA